MAANTQSHKAGFTLVEILVVVAIIAVVGSFVLVNFVTGAPMRKLDKAQYQITADMRNARMEAITKMTRVQFTFNTSAKTYAIWTDNNRNGTADTGETKTKTLSDVGGVSFSTYPSSGTFLPNGQFSSSYYYHYVYIANSAGYRYIYTFPSGAVDPYKP